MIDCTSFHDLLSEIQKVYNGSSRNIFLILIGGCSRSGKTTLSNKLSAHFNESGIDTLVVGLDSWLIGINERKPDSTVIERYEMQRINSDLEVLLNGGIVTPPVYDPVSRKRVAEKAEKSLMIKTGIVIIEGVVALCDPGLIAKKGVSVFVRAPHLTRIKRLLDFYGRVKKIPREEYKQIIRKREKEEVPFIDRSVDFADLIYAS